MAKTIEIDDVAFECLEQAREQGESWSALIRRCVRRKRTFDEVMVAIGIPNISDETLAAMDEVVSRRRSIPSDRARG